MAQATLDPIERLAAQHGLTLDAPAPQPPAAASEDPSVTVTPPATAAADDPVAALAEKHGLTVETPTFKTTNAKDAAGNAEVDPNTIGTLARTFWKGVDPLGVGQMLPWPKAAGGSGEDNPLFPTTIVKQLHAVKQQADALWAKGDKVGASAKYIESVVPILGPLMSSMGDDAQTGHWAKLAGTTAALAANIAMGKSTNAMLDTAYPLASQADAGAKVGATMTRPEMLPPARQAVDFGRARGVPIDAATASDNLAVKGTQALADRSLGGSLVATPARAAQSAAMERVANELADETHPNTLTPEQAGTSVRDALAKKVQAHATTANAAYDTLRDLEQTPTDESVGSTRSETTVKLKSSKQALQPIYDQMKRQMPVTQQQSSAGLKAIENILTGPDFAPLSQVDRDLSAIKSVARDQGGIAKIAVSRLDEAVQQAALAGGPAMTKALKEGRAATVAKYAVSDVLDDLHDEPVRTINMLTAPKDAAIGQLRDVLQHVPDQAPVIARAKLEDILNSAQPVATWNKLGEETKATLFPKTAANLDRFFALTDRISKTNVNPSGSGYVVSLATQGSAIGTGLVLSIATPGIGVPILASEAGLQIGGAVLAKLLRSPAAVNALTRGLQLPNTAPAAVRAAATANLVTAAKQAGVVLDWPKAADQEAATR